MVDELEEVQINIIIRKEERKFLLRKLCEYEPQIALEVQNTAKDGPLSRTSGIDNKKTKKKPHMESIGKFSIKICIYLFILYQLIFNYFRKKIVFTKVP